ncbi:hypothetical protein [Roseivirga sp. E12]|uniref:hypothetical protein n=1 Tax=Roseivirga sp. E12 TaxID=2819237 RepID=UPI001ABC7E44|nr:hypothetical protein [Roseivirga sp. E12]MBO3698318.1 hypothetical protein [Roseivirga sp. E12]
MFRLLLNTSDDVVELRSTINSQLANLTDPDPDPEPDATDDDGGGTGNPGSGNGPGKTNG